RLAPDAVLQIADRACRESRRKRSRAAERAPAAGPPPNRASHQMQTGISIYGCAPNPQAFRVHRGKAFEGRARESVPVAGAAMEYWRTPRTAIHFQSAR